MKKFDLDDDFIGGLGAMTKEEEMALSAYFKDKKLKSQKKVHIGHLKSKKHQNVTV